MFDVIDILPNKLSDLIEVALKDLREIEKNPNYVIDMGFWHTSDVPDQYGQNPACHVCLAGAVMAQQLNIQPTEQAAPALFNQSLQYKLMALDYARAGDVACALSIFYFGDTGNYEKYSALNDPHIPEYKENPEVWYEHMIRIIGTLRQMNL